MYTDYIMKYSFKNIDDYNIFRREHDLSVAWSIRHDLLQ